MVAILECSSAADRLESRSVFGEPMEFSEAWRRGTWIGADPHLALLLLGDEVRWLGRAQGGKIITSMDRIVRITEIEEIDALPIAEIRVALAPRFRDALDRIGILPPRGAAAVVEALKQVRPFESTLIDRLQRPGSFDLPSGRRGELLNLQRDGVGLLLDLAEVSRRVLRSWSTTQVDVPFLAGLPDNTAALEDQLINHDTERFGNWIPVPTNQIAWRAFTDGAHRIFIMNANRDAVEHTLGVDVVYWNERDDSFVMVQYKKMTREDREGRTPQTRLIYRPDSKLQPELDRMRRIDEACLPLPGPFRLLSTPCWLKLCEPYARVNDPAELIKGMYFAREHFEERLQACKGPRGGTVIGYDNAGRYLNNSLFIDLVRGGWVGSRGMGSDRVRDLLAESIETRHAVVFGVESTQPDGANITL